MKNNTNSNSNKKNTCGLVITDLKKLDPLYDLCIQSFNDFGIKKFIESNIEEPIKSYLIQDAVHFVGHVRTQISENHLSIKKDYTHQAIVRFTDFLAKYLECLSKESDTTDIFNNGYIPKIDTIESATNELRYYRNQLLAMHTTIDLEVALELDKCRKCNYKALQKDWDDHAKKSKL